MRPEYSANRRRNRFGRVRRAFLADLLPADFENRVTWAETLPPIDLPQAWGAFHRGFDLLGDGSLVAIDLTGHTESQLGLGFAAEEAGGTFLVADACWKIEGLRERRPPSRLAHSLFADPAALSRHLRGPLRSLRHAGSPPDHSLALRHDLGGLAGQRILRRE